MIATLLSDLIPWLAVIGGALVAFLGYGRHQKGKGRQEVARDIRSTLLEADKDASDVAKDAIAAVDRADPDGAFGLRRKWTRRPF